MTALFDRVVVVTMADGTTTGTKFAGATPGGDIGFDIDFAVQRSRTSEPNQAEIVIWNLARASRSQFAQWKRIRIEAGYVGASDLIFDGDITQVWHRREDDGLTTTIRAADGEMAWQHAKINTTLDAPTPMQALQALVAEMPGVSLGRIYGLETAPRFTRPLVMHGLVRDRLDELARSYDARWSIQNGVFEWVANTEAGRRVQIPVISPDSGLVGLPEPTEKGVKVTCLLTPGIKPNDVVEIRSAYLTVGRGKAHKDDKKDDFRRETLLGGGVFRVDTVEFRGSTYGDEFFAELECTRLAGDKVEQQPTRDQALAASGRG